MDVAVVKMENIPEKNPVRNKKNIRIYFGIFKKSTYECHVVKCFLPFISLLKNTAAKPNVADTVPAKNIYM